MRSGCTIQLQVQFPIWLFLPSFATIAMQSITGFQRHSPVNTIKSTYLIFNSFGAWKLLFSMAVHIIVTFHSWSIYKIVNFWCAHGMSHGHGQNTMGVPMPTVTGMLIIFWPCPWLFPWAHQKFTVLSIGIMLQQWKVIIIWTTIENNSFGAPKLLKIK